MRRWEGTFSSAIPGGSCSAPEIQGWHWGSFPPLPPIPRWERALCWQQDGSAHSHFLWVSSENSPPKPAPGTGKPNECRKPKFAFNLRLLALLLNRQQTATKQGTARFYFLLSLMAVIANQCSVLPLFLLRFSPLAFLHCDPSWETAKKLTLNQMAALVPGTDSRQQLRDPDTAGKMSRIHIDFGVLWALFV